MERQVERYRGVKGAYQLELVVRRHLEIEVGRLGALVFARGRYYYLGSAHGPGGLGARVARHLGAGSRRCHWHIDYLIEAVGVRRVRYFPEGRECSLVEDLRSRSGVSVPHPRFGSSDCARCEAHLLYHR